MKDSTFIKLSTLAAPNNHDIPRTTVEQTLLDLYRKKYWDIATADNAIKEFLRFCENRTELLVPASSDDMFKFFHRSFFEFFYARHLYQCESCETIIEKMKEFDIDSEVFELTVALIKADNEEKYQDLMESIFAKTEAEFDSQPAEKCSCLAFGILSLAMQAVDDELYIKRYYGILIKYKNYMDNKHVLRLSQLVYNLASKGCSKDEDKKAILAAFEKSCVQFILSRVHLFLSRASIYDTFVKKDGKITNLPIIAKGDLLTGSAQLQLPFYILLFEKFGSLYDLMEQVINESSGFSQTIVKGRKNRQVKRALEYYRKMNQGQRAEVINLILKPGKK